MRFQFSVGLLLFVSLGALGSAMESPLSTSGLRRYLSSHPGIKLETFLDALPESHHKNFALVYASRSLQKATLERPRQLLFGWDARFLMGIGSVPTDPRSQEVEFAELDPKSGVYHFGLVDFRGGSAEVHEDVPLCLSCHGAPPRPIWGTYDHWTGVYSDDGNVVDGDDHFIPSPFRKELAQLLARMPTDSRYRHLKMKVVSYCNSDCWQGFQFVDRIYPFPNSDITAALANTMGLSLITRIENHPRYRDLRWALLGLSSNTYRYLAYPMPACTAFGTDHPLSQKVIALYRKELVSNPGFAERYGTETRDLPPIAMAFRLVGIDPAKDMDLTNRVPESQVTDQFWNSGLLLHLDQIVAGFILEELVKTDPYLAEFYNQPTDGVPAYSSHSGKTYLDLIRGYRAGLSLFGDELGALLKTTFKISSPSLARMVPVFQHNLQREQCQYLADQTPPRGRAR